MKIYSPLFSRRDFEDLQVKRSLDSILKTKRGYTFKIPSKKANVILTVSGGIDSIMLWFNLLHKYHFNVYPIFFIKPNSSRGERNSVRFFYLYFKKLFPSQINPVKYLPVHFNFHLNNKNRRTFFENNPSLFIKNIFINKMTRNTKILPSNEPIRLAYFMLAAYEYGLELRMKGIDTHTIFTGISPDDGKVNRESTHTVLRALNVYLCSILGDWQWQFTGPLEKKSHFYFPKATAIKIATLNNLPIEKTWSCMRTDTTKHCGKCSLCVKRQLSFQEAKIPDKTDYFLTPSLRNLLKSIYYTIFHYSGKHSDSIANKYVQLNKKNILKYRICISSEVTNYQYNKSNYYLNKKRNEIIQVNRVGNSIVSQIKKKPQSLDDLVENIMNQFSTNDAKQVKKEVIEFINKMIEKQIFLLQENSVQKH